MWKLSFTITEVIKMILAPSVLSLHFENFREELDILNKEADWIHFDVMDGHLVPNLSFGEAVFKAFRRNSPLFLDVHLMVDDPEHYTDVFARAGADSIIFHYEAFHDIEKCRALLRKIKSMYLKAGLSIKPGTKVEEILPLLDDVDIFLMMSVEPGFGGQKFMEDAYERISKVDAYRKQHDLNLLIEVDGGVSDQNARRLLECGCDALVAGSNEIEGDMHDNIARIRRCAIEQ